MAQNRLSYKYVKSIIAEYNDSKGLKHKDKGFVYLGGDSGWYELFVMNTQGSTGVHSLERGTLKECHDAFYDYKYKEENKNGND